MDSNLFVIILTILNMIISLSKQFLNNRKQNDLRDVIMSSLRQAMTVVSVASEESPLSPVTLKFPEHLKASVMQMEEIKNV